jgi:hypothetical protein
MTVRIKHKVNVQAWEEVEQKNVLFAPNDARAEITIDNMEHISSGVLTIEDDSDMDVPLPDIQTVRGIFLKADQDVIVTINGGDPQQLRRPSEGTEDAPTYCHFFLEGDITSVNVEKPATTPAADSHVRWVVWGNPEA